MVTFGLFCICSKICSAVSSAVSSAVCSAFLSAPRLDAFTEASLLAMSAIIFPAASWQGIVMRKNVRSSSVTTVARGEPLFSNTFCMVGIPVERPSVYIQFFKIFSQATVAVTF